VFGVERRIRFFEKAQGMQIFREVPIAVLLAGVVAVVWMLRTIFRKKP